MMSRRSLIDFAQIVVRPSVHLMDFMKGLGGKGWLFVVAINWLLGAELHSAEVNVETLLTDINRKPAEQRLQALMEGAKKEGIVYHYGSINAPDNDELTRAFNKQYPFVEVRYTRLGAEQIVNRAMAEYRSSPQCRRDFHAWNVYARALGKENHLPLQKPHDGLSASRFY